MNRRETKTVRNLRRRVRNHTIDALHAVIELAKRDPKTDPIKLQRLMLTLREAAGSTRELWTYEDVGIKTLSPGVFTVGN